MPRSTTRYAIAVRLDCILEIFSVAYRGVVGHDDIAVRKVDRIVDVREFPELVFEGPGISSTRHAADAHGVQNLFPSHALAVIDEIRWLHQPSRSGVAPGPYEDHYTRGSAGTPSAAAASGRRN